MSAGKLLPRAMLIDMDDGILSSHGRPEIAWANADASWRLKLAEARHLTVKGGFAALAAAGHRAARRSRHEPGRSLHQLSRRGYVHLPGRA
jgi:putative hydrolase of the HAD superfamily